MSPNADRPSPAGAGNDSRESRSKQNEVDVSRYCYYLSSREARDSIVNYQYKGQDLSLLYIHVLSPLATFCVNNLTPTWLAPNTITTIGLVFMILAYVIYWHFVPSLEFDANDEPPRWIFLYNCIAMLVYQTLDNMDGKQARKTNSSSPMGLLFDHGCDAINSIFGSANWIIGMGLNPLQSRWDLVISAVIIFGPYLTFFIATWEEYYTGELILPIVNGPSDGLFGGAMLSLTSFLIGPMFWQEQNWFEAILRVCPQGMAENLQSYTLRNCDLLVGVAMVAFVQEYGSKSYHVIQTYGGSSMLKQLPFLALLGCFVAIGLQTPEVLLDQPRTSMHLIAVLFVDMSTEMMLCHIAHQNYNPWRWQLIPLVVLALASGLIANGIEDGVGLQDQMKTWITAYASAIFAYNCMKTSVILHEMCQLLDISCFTIHRPNTTSDQAKKVQ